MQQSNETSSEKLNAAGKFLLRAGAALVLVGIALLTFVASIKIMLN